MQSASRQAAARNRVLRPPLLPNAAFPEMLRPYRPQAAKGPQMPKPPTAFDLRPDWLALRSEPAIAPDLPVIDSHHHLYHRPGLRYLLEDYLADLHSGHDIRASVAVQARAMLRSEGPPDLASLGETEFLNGQAAMADSGVYGNARIAARIVAHVDLTLGARLRPVLERHIAAAGGLARDGGRLGGIRQPLAWDADASLYNPAYPTTKDMADSASFRAGLSVLQSLGLPFEIWAYYPQLPRLAALARAFPDLPFVVNHLGGIVRAHEHAGRDVFAAWHGGMAALAACPSVLVKLSGLGMRLSSFGFDDAPLPPSSADLAAVWRPWVHTALDLFGPDRCMWGSNFPVDKGSYSYATGLNAFKLLLQDAPTKAQEDVFWRTASRHYALEMQ